MSKTSKYTLNSTEIPENLSQCVLTETTINLLKKVSLRGRPKSIYLNKEAQLIWQYVRFNSRYQKIFDRIAKHKDNNKLMQQNGLQWEMIRLWDYRKDRLPNELARFLSVPTIPFYLPELPTIKNSINRVIYKDRKIHKILMPMNINLNPLLVLINVTDDEETVIDGVREAFRRARNKISKNQYPIKGIRGRAVDNLLSNFICYYFKEVKGLSVCATNNFLRKYLNLNINLQGHQLKKRIKTFKKISTASPWIFFRKKS